MKTTSYFAVAVVALAINFGCFAGTSNAQYSSYNGHAGSCAGGCSHASYDHSLELVPFGQAGQSAMQQNYPSQRVSPYYGRAEMMSRQSGYAQPLSNSDPYRSSRQPAYRSGSNGSNFNAEYDRRGQGQYESRREDFTYANGPGSEYSRLETYGHESCRGGCSHGQRGGYDSQRFENRQFENRQLEGQRYPGQRYEGDRQPAFDGGMSYRTEADQTPRLNFNRLDRGNQSAAYLRSEPPRQERLIPQMRGEIGTTSQDMFSPSGPPPASLGVPNGSSSSGCDHAGCDHDHN